DPDSGLTCDFAPPYCDDTGLEPATVVLNRTDSTTVVGGHVYRGSAIPWLRGAYIYSDFNNATAWWIRWENGALTAGPTDVGAQIGVAASSGYGLDNDGEMYIVSASAGTLYRIEAE